MRFLHLLRRLHLYLGLFLLPWLFMYGVSSIPFAHNTWIRSMFYADGVPDWSLRFERPFSIDIPADGNLRPIGARILRESGVPEGAFGAYRQPDGRLEVYRHDFWSATRLTYYPEQKRLVAQDRRFRLDHFLTGMHARGGFEQAGVLNTLWGTVVDVVCAGMLVWILSGLFMWWHVPGHRLYGSVALAGGVAAFVVFLIRL